MREVSEIRTICFRLGPFGLLMKESHWVDMDYDKRCGWAYFVILDELDLAYRQGVGEVK